MTHRLTYIAAMVLAAAAFFIMRRLQPQPEIPIPLTWQQRLGLMLGAFVGGPLGAKLPFVLTDIQWGSEAGWDQAMLWFADGKTVTTGLVGAYLGVEVTKWALEIRAKTGDGFAIPLATAMAVGRWGCFFNGCCYGIATELPWGVDFLGDGLRHPTQIYESLFHGLMACLLWPLAQRNLLARQRLKLYLLAYCGYRFVTEWIRPEERHAGGLTFYQWVVISFALFLVVQWIWDERSKQAALKPA